MSCGICRGAGIRFKRSDNPQRCFRCKGTGHTSGVAVSSYQPAIPIGWTRCAQCGKTGLDLELFMGKKGRPVQNCIGCQYYKVTKVKKIDETISICVPG